VAISADSELLDWGRNNAETSYDPVGTCKMGVNSMAAVDDQLRVRDVAGLSVADADHADVDLRQPQCAVDHDRRGGRAYDFGFDR
jgi:hypothetical protein